MPKGKIVNGKYGNIGGLDAITEIYNLTHVIGLDKIDKKLNTEINTDLEGKRDQLAFSQTSAKDIIEGDHGINFITSFDNTIEYSYGKLSSLDEHVETIERIHDTVSQKINKLPKKYDYVSGHLNVLKVISDPKNDYARAKIENSCLFELQGMQVLGFKDKKNPDKFAKNISSVKDPKTGLPQPLTHIKNFMNNVANLYELEFKKHKIDDHYNQEAETAFLIEYKEALTKTLEDYDSFVEFGKKHIDNNGKSKFDQFFDNKLNVMTGTVLNDSDGNRSPRSVFEHLRGQKKAIENGWGMNELDILGYVARIEDSIRVSMEIEKLRYDKSYSKEQIEKTQKKINNRINEINEYLKTAKGYEKKNYQDELDNIKRDQKKYETKSYVKEHNDFISDNEKLLTDVRKLKEKFYNTKVNSLKDKQALLLDFKKFMAGADVDKNPNLSNHVELFNRVNNYLKKAETVLVEENNRRKDLNDKNNIINEMLEIKNNNIILDDNKKSKNNNIILNDNKKSKNNNIILNDKKEKKNSNIILDDKESENNNIILDDKKASKNNKKKTSNEINQIIDNDADSSLDDNIIITTDKKKKTSRKSDDIEIIIPVKEKKTSQKNDDIEIIPVKEKKKGNKKENIIEDEPKINIAKEKSKTNNIEDEPKINTNKDESKNNIIKDESKINIIDDGIKEEDSKNNNTKKKRKKSIIEIPDLDESIDNGPKKIDKNNKIFNGKYGAAGARNTIQDIYTTMLGVEADCIDKSIIKRISEDNGEKLPYMTDLTMGMDRADPPVDTKFGQTPLPTYYNHDSIAEKKKKKKIPDVMSPEDHIDFIDEIHEKFDNVLKNPTPEQRLFKGQFEIIRIITDKTKDYARAILDCPYLTRFMSNTASGFRIGKDKYSVEEIEEKFGTKHPNAQDLKTPLEYINTMHENSTKFFDLEFERQKAEDSKNPELENAYLVKLYNHINKTIDDYAEFQEFGRRVVDEKGKSEYDKYLNNPFDFFTGINKETANGARSMEPDVWHLKGEKKAIENGFGQKELFMFGYFSEFEYCLNNLLKKTKEKIEDYRGQAINADAVLNGNGQKVEPVFADPEVKKAYEDEVKLLEDANKIHASFKKHKNNIWNHQIGCAADKLFVADGLASFYKDYKEVIEKSGEHSYTAVSFGTMDTLVNASVKNIKALRPVFLKEHVKEYNANKKESIINDLDDNIININNDNIINTNNDNIIKIDEKIKDGDILNSKLSISAKINMARQKRELSFPEAKALMEEKLRADLIDMNPAMKDLYNNPKNPEHDILNAELKKLSNAVLDNDQLKKPGSHFINGEILADVLDKKVLADKLNEVRTRVNIKVLDQNVRYFRSANAVWDNPEYKEAKKLYDKMEANPFDQKYANKEKPDLDKIPQHITKTVNQGLSDAKKSLNKTWWLPTSTSNFEDIKDFLDDIITLKKGFDKKINDSLKKGEPPKVNQKDFDKFNKKMRQCLSAMNHYIETHENRGWFRKGFTGDQRLEAVKETRQALYYLNRRSEAYGNIVASKDEVKLANAPYVVDGEQLMEKLGRRKGINKEENKNSFQDKINIFESNDNIIDTRTNKNNNKGMNKK